MKTARVGTILPWGGDGSQGNTAANIPKGWEVCDGQQADANEYPLLFSEIGNTYGGTGTGTFPIYSGEFFFPKLTNRCMRDLEPADLNETKYQYGQGNVTDTVVDAVGTKFGDYIVGFGTTQVIKTSWSANADIDFGLSDPDLKLSGKITNMGITDPDFTATVTTLNRKLGINHTPGHSHQGQFSSAQASFYGPQIWKPTSLTISGSTDHPNCSVVKSINHTCDLNPSVGQAPDWSNGRTLTAFYGSDQHEHTLPSLEKFHNYVNDAGDTVLVMSAFNPTFSTIVPAVDGVINVTGLPAGTEVFLDGVSKGTMSDTPLTLTAKEPGKYLIEFKKLDKITYAKSIRTERQS